MMLDGGGYDMPSLVPEEALHAEDRQIVAFRAATGEDNFARLHCRHRPRDLAPRPAARAPGHPM